MEFEDAPPTACTEAVHSGVRSYSDDNGGSCLEVLDGIPGAVPVRDSKVPDGPVLVVPAAARNAFVVGVVTGG
ncbi:DUF397 domain-containing protein [Streptomyces sp. SCSIO 30461]